MRKLGAQVADPALGKTAGERQAGGFGGDEFLSVIADCVISDGTGGIKEDVVRSPVAGCIEAERELVVRGEIDVELAVGGVADLSGGIYAGQRRQLSSRCENKSLVGGVIVSRRVGTGAGLGDNLRTAVQKLDDVGSVKEMLVESGKEKCPVRDVRTGARSRSR